MPNNPTCVVSLPRTSGTSPDPQVGRARGLLHPSRQHRIGNDFGAAHMVRPLEAAAQFFEQFVSSDPADAGDHHCDGEAESRSLQHRGFGREKPGIMADQRRWPPFGSAARVNRQPAKIALENVDGEPRPQPGKRPPEAAAVVQKADRKDRQQQPEDRRAPTGSWSRHRNAPARAGAIRRSRARNRCLSATETAYAHPERSSSFFERSVQSLDAAAIGLFRKGQGKWRSPEGAEFTMCFDRGLHIVANFVAEFLTLLMRAAAQNAHLRKHVHQQVVTRNDIQQEPRQPFANRIDDLLRLFGVSEIVIESQFRLVRASPRRCHARVRIERRRGDRQIARAACLSRRRIRNATERNPGWKSSVSMFVSIHSMETAGSYDHRCRTPPESPVILGGIWGVRTGTAVRHAV